MSELGSRKKPSRLQLVGALLVFLLLVLSISGGIATGLGYTPRSRLLGWVLCIGGTVVAVLTVDWWATILPGIFGIATLNGIIILISGHALNQPSVSVPRIISLFLTIVMAGGSVATMRSGSARLTSAERAAYVGVLCCFIAMFTCVSLSVANWELPVCIGFVACISLLWAETLFMQRRGK
jgi:hypothetical protein